MASSMTISCGGGSAPPFATSAESSTCIASSSPAVADWAVEASELAWLGTAVCLMALGATVAELETDS